jgi:MFS family permease
MRRRHGWRFATSTQRVALRVHCATLSAMWEGHGQVTEGEQSVAARTAVRASTGARSVFAMAGLAVLLTQTGVSLTAAALPLYLRDLGAPSGRIGLEVGAGFLAGVLAMLALGPALNRRGPRPFLLLGGVLGLTSALAMLAVPSEGAVTGFRVLQGVGVAVFMPSVSTLVIELFPARPATALGLIYSVNSLANACGPPLGLALYDARGAAGLFLPAALLSALGLAATCLLPPGRPVHGTRGFGIDHAWAPLFAASACSIVYYGGVSSYLALHMRATNGPNAGIYFTADNAGSVVFRAASGVMVERAGSRWPKVLGGALIVPGVLLLALAPSPLTLAAAGALTGGGAGLLLSVITADLARLSTSSNRGTALALGAASVGAGAFVGSAASGLCFAAGGFDAVVGLSALATLAALPFALGPRRTPATRGDP